MIHRVHWLLLPALLFVVLASPLLHADNGDQVHFAQSITIGEDQNAGDLVCIACSIRVAGTCGDVVALAGNVIVDGTVKGDAVAIAGNIRLGEDASVMGDVVTVAGRLLRNPNATVKGEISSRSGVLVLLGLLVVPLLPVILIIALVVWLATRNRQASPVRA